MKQLSDKIGTSHLMADRVLLRSVSFWIDYRGVGVRVWVGCGVMLGVTGVRVSVGYGVGLNV
jgi:hypothetical protein